MVKTLAWLRLKMSTGTTGIRDKSPRKALAFVTRAVFTCRCSNRRVLCSIWLRWQCYVGHLHALFFSVEGKYTVIFRCHVSHPTERIIHWSTSQMTKTNWNIDVWECLLLERRTPNLPTPNCRQKSQTGLFSWNKIDSPYEYFLLILKILIKFFFLNCIRYERVALSFGIISCF